MSKPVPVLHLEQFQEPATLHSHFYVQLLEEHLAQYQYHGGHGVTRRKRVLRKGAKEARKGREEKGILHIGSHGGKASRRGSPPRRG